MCVCNSLRVGELRERVREREQQRKEKLRIRTLRKKQVSCMNGHKTYLLKMFNKICRIIHKFINLIICVKVTLEACY